MGRFGVELGADVMPKALEGGRIVENVYKRL